MFAQIDIFSTPGVEPRARIGSGVVELIAAILPLGHLAALGIDVQGDGGTLFALAVDVFMCCAIAAWPRRGRVAPA